MLSLPMRFGTSRPLVLVAEDDPLIAMDLETTLSHEGFYVVGPALSVAAALLLLEQTDPDAAVLDMNLNGELITPVAEMLFERAIPFMLASGSDNTKSDLILAEAENIGKPVDEHLLVERLGALLMKSAGHRH